MTAPRERRSEQPETTDTAAAQADPADARARSCATSRCGAPARRRGGPTPPTCSSCSSGWRSATSRSPISARTQVRAFSAELGRRGYAPATLARKLSTLRGFTRHLTEAGVLAADPARSLPGPRRRRRLPRVLSLADVDALVAATEGTDPLALRDRLILELLYGCGLRSMELVALRLGDVQAAQAQLIVRGKGGKMRIVPLGDEAAAALRRYLERGRGELERRRGLAGPAAAEPPLAGGSAAPLEERPRAADLRRSPTRSKIQSACGYRSGVAAHVAARVRDAHAREGCRSSCHPGTVGARLRLDHAGVHARQRGAPAAHL